MTHQKGNNPFDKFLKKSPSDAESYATIAEQVLGSQKRYSSVETESNTQWERMKAARRAAEMQREFTQESLKELSKDHEKVEDAPSEDKTRSSYLSLPYLWKVLVMGFWGYLSLAAVWGNPIGGLIVAVPLFFAAVLLAKVPFYLGGAVSTSSNARGNAI